MNESTSVAHLKIQALLGHLSAAWQAGQGDQYAANFSDDATYVTFDGTYLRGRAAIAQFHQELFDGLLRGSELEGSGITGLQLLAPNVALLHSTGAVRMRWQKKAPTGRASIQTLVAVREGETWKLAAFQNTRITLPGLFAKLFLRLMK